MNTEPVQSYFAQFPMVSEICSGRSASPWSGHPSVRVELYAVVHEYQAQFQIGSAKLRWQRIEGTRRMNCDCRVVVEILFPGFSFEYGIRSPQASVGIDLNCRVEDACLSHARRLGHDGLSVAFERSQEFADVGSKVHTLGV